MKAIKVNMPDEVYEKLESLASQDHQSVNVFASRKLKEFARAVEDFKDLEHRTQRASRVKFESAMAKVSKGTPVPGDELPK
jgi:predicted transcriptional regulator